jgi:hypothetical protein
MRQAFTGNAEVSIPFNRLNQWEPARRLDQWAK